jgi:hypothetical protein
VTRRTRRLAVAAGVALLAVGLRGIVSDALLTHPVNWALFFIGGALAHDLLLAPAVAVVGTVARRVPVSVRPLVFGGMVVTGLLTAVALPVVLGFGRRPDNPSQLPLDYGRNLVLVLVLVLVWVAVAVLAFARNRRRG